MKFFLIAWVFTLSLGQLGRWQVTPQIAVYLHEFLMLGWLTWAAWSGQVTLKKIVPKWQKINNFSQKIILSLLGVILLGWLLSFLLGEFDPRSWLYTSKLGFYLSFTYLFQRQLRWSSQPWLLISALLLLGGFLQYFFIPDLRFLVYAGFDDHYYRLAGTLLDPSFLGLILVFALNYYTWQHQLSFIELLVVVALIIGLALTYARAAYLALLLGSLVAMYSRYRQHLPIKSIIWSLVGFACLLPLLPTASGGAGVDLGRQFSLEQRLNNNQLILQQLKTKDWLLGQGLFHPQDRLSHPRVPGHAHFADNLLVWAVSNLGLIGAGLLLLLWWQAVRQANPLQQTLWASWLTHSMFNHNLTQSFVLLIFLGLYWSRSSVYRRNSTSI